MKTNTEEMMFSFLDRVSRDGWPVYPRDYHFGESKFEDAGILLRDEIAIKAMVAIIGKLPPLNGARESMLSDVDAVARGAYAYANAMLKERSL